MKNRTTIGRCLSKACLRVTKFPRDFPIFCPPTVTMLLCIQYLTNGLSLAASLWAISHSWWGNTFSRPPPCISKVSPRYRMDMAEHSRCQPGKPSPQGLLHLRMCPGRSEEHTSELQSQSNL